MLTAAKKIAAEKLPILGLDGNYGIGFMGVHKAKEDNFVFIDWWAHENELYHHGWVSTSDNFDTLIYITPNGMIGCTWVLRIISFERDAWANAILTNPRGPDMNVYLTAKLNEVI